jgi:DNA-binding LacI/PurR family transcriptional regulator
LSTTHPNAFDPVTLPTTTQQRVADQLLRRLRRDNGDEQALPPEREMARVLEVSRPTLRKVLQEMERAGVIRSYATRGRLLTARQAGSGHSHVLPGAVAVITPILERSPGHAAPGWDDQLATAVYHHLQTGGLPALAVNPYMLDQDQIEWLLRGRPRGFVILGMAEFVQNSLMRKLIDSVLNSGAPVVAMADPSLGTEIDTVDADHALGGERVTRWLIEQGCRSIRRVWAHVQKVPVPRPKWLIDRDNGYERAMREAGLKPQPALEFAIPKFHGDMAQSFEHESRMLATHMLEEFSGPDQPDALMTLSDGDYFRVATAVRRLGLTPQEDILVAGYDNYWVDCPERQFESVPPIVTLDKNNPVIGRRLAQLLADRLAAGAGEPTNELIEPTVIADPSAQRRRVDLGEANR